MYSYFFEEELNFFLILILIILYSYYRNYKKIFLIFIIILVFLILFYRDENRLVLNPTENTLYSPCDGTVMSCTDKELIVFLSPLDMHIQKAPCDCKIISTKYKKGEFNPAYLLEKTNYNEKQTTIFQLKDRSKIEIDQIAGQIARRIVNWKKSGDILRAGENYGMIKFGSQVRVRPPYGYTLQCKKGNKIKAGQNIIYILKNKDDR